MKTRRTILAVVSIILVLSTFVAPGLADTSTDAREPITIRVQTPNYQLESSGPHVSGYQVNRVPGAPALPVYQTVVELPDAGDWSLTFDAPGARVLDPIVTVNAAPTPDTELDRPRASGDPDDLPAEPALVTRPDPAIYEADAFYPAEPVIAGEVQSQRGRRFLPLQVFPFQYNPVSGNLRYWPDIEITISLSPATDAESSGIIAPTSM